MVQVPTSPSVLAVLLGVIELLILESFRFLLGRALAARRSGVLSRVGKLHLLSASRQNDRVQWCISGVSIVVVVVLIVLELSIEGIVMRSTGSPVPAMCSAPDRLTRYYDGFGPTATEANDTRFAAYVEQTGCRNSMLNAALSGSGGLLVGYPNCTAPFDEPKQRTFVSEFQGCGIGFVSHSEAGDVHCDVLPFGIGSAPTLASSSFLAVLESGHNSTASFVFNADSDQRYLSNSRIPSTWMLNSTDESVSVDCVDISLDCYILSRERARAAAKTVVESRARSGIYMQVLQNGNSSVCLFENGMRAQAEWVEMNQSLPGADERTRRSGPVFTGFVLSGEARCVENLDASVARLQYDATEFAVAPPEGAAALVDWLQRHVVGLGIKTPFDKSKTCYVSAVIEGSSISSGWLIGASTLSGLVVLVSVAAVVFIVWVRMRSGLKGDPLRALWSIREVLRLREEGGSGDDGSARVQGDVFVGVVERGDVARFEVFNNDNFDTVRRSKKRFLQLQ